MNSNKFSIKQCATKAFIDCRAVVMVFSLGGGNMWVWRAPFINFIKSKSLDEHLIYEWGFVKMTQ